MGQGRAGWIPGGALEARTRCLGPSARPMVEARLETASDLRQRGDQWSLADGGLSTNFEILADGGLRLKPTNLSAVGPTAHDSYYRSKETGVSGNFLDPIATVPGPQSYVGMALAWSGTAVTNYSAVTAWLKPQYDPTKSPLVRYWEMLLYEIVPIGAVNASPFGVFQMSELAGPIRQARVKVVTQLEGFVTFTFQDPSGKALLFRPKTFRPGSAILPAAGTQYLILIHGYDANWKPATNIAWGADSTQQQFIVGTAPNQLQFNGAGFIVYPRQGGRVAFGPSPINIPAMQLIPVSVPASASVVFSTGSPIDLGSTPATPPELVVRGETPPGTSIVAQVAADPIGGGSYTTFVDGEATSYVGTPPTGYTNLGLPTQRKYDMKVTLNADAGLAQTPILRVLGARVVSVAPLYDVAEVTSWQERIDPLTHAAEVGEFIVRAVHNGERDFRDAISRLLSENPPGNFYMRVYHGDKSLSKSQWLHIDDGLVDDSDYRGPDVGLTCLTTISQLKQALPKLSSDVVGAPTSPISNTGSWTSNGPNLIDGLADLASATASGAPVDQTYDQSPVNPTSAQFVVQLSPMGTPAQVIVGQILIQFRAALAAGTNCALVAELLNASGTVRGFTSTFAVTQPDTGEGSYTPYSGFLTAQQIATITTNNEWGNLRLRFTATGTGGAQVRVGWARVVQLGTRATLQYPSASLQVATIQTVMDDLIVNQVALPGGYRGPKYTDPPLPLSVAKTIYTTNAASSSTDLTQALQELNALAFLAGYAFISNQGKIECVPLYGVTTVPDVLTGENTPVFTPLTAPSPSVVVPLAEIEPLQILPGWRQRVGAFAVPWGFIDPKTRQPTDPAYTGEANVVDLFTISQFPSALIETQLRASAIVSQWIPTSTLAEAVALRHTSAFGLGLLEWRFRTTYARPEWKLGDVITIAVDQFLAYDPIATRALAGRLWATGVLMGKWDAMGYEWSIWIQNYSSLQPIPAPAPLTAANTPKAILYLTANQTITTATPTLVDWTAESEDVTVNYDPFSSIATAPLSAGMHEVAAHNDVLHSEDFSTGWTANKATILPAVGTWLNGVQTVNRVVEDTTATSNHNIHPTVGTTLVAGQSIVCGCYARAGTRTKVRVSCANGANGFQVDVDIGAGGILLGTSGGFGTGTLTTTYITPLVGGWFRIIGVGTLGGAITTAFPNLFLLNASGSDTYTGDGLSYADFCGCQLEINETVPHSYLRTVGFKAVGAERLTIPYGMDNGSWVFEFQGRWGTTGSPVGIRLIQLYKNDGANPIKSITDAGVSDHNQPLSYVEHNPVVGDYFRIAVEHTQGANLDLVGTDPAFSSFTATHFAV